jgi:hypothetical protein
MDTVLMVTVKLCINGVNKVRTARRLCADFEATAAGMAKYGTAR